MQIDHLLVQLADSKACADLLDDWHWLTGSKKRPFLLTASGNAFVHDIGDGTVDLLDVSAACLSRVADTREGFHELLQTASFADSYLNPKLIEGLRDRGLILKRNQIYSWRVPLSLGGNATLENIEIADIGVHFAVTGQIEQQILGLPDGAPIADLKFTGRAINKPWWKVW